MRTSYRRIIEKCLEAKGIKAFAAYDKRRSTYVILTVGCDDDILRLCTQILRNIYDNDKRMTEQALKFTPYNFIPPVVLDVSAFGTRLELYGESVWVRHKKSAASSPG